jgi:hypothetical protein
MASTSERGLPGAMRKRFLVIFGAASLLAALACSPRDFLTRRLAGDLIAGSPPFKTTQQFGLRIGIVSNKNYLSPEYLVLQHRGWISATNAACPAELAPPPCWDVVLTPAGVDTIRPLIPAEDAAKSFFSIPVARREVIAIGGIGKEGNFADVDFTWRWVPLNEVGAALYSSDLHYSSTVSFRNYDDGWRLAPGPVRTGQSIDDALKNAEPAP